MTSAATEQIDNCNVCDREITEEAALEGPRCILCRVCPFCSSTFTLTNRSVLRSTKPSLML